MNSSCFGSCHLYREVNCRSLVVVVETVFLISFKFIFSLNWLKNLLCLENWQHKHSVIFWNVLIAYLTIAVVLSKRLTDANSVKALIPYIGPKFTPSFPSAGTQKCLSVNLFQYEYYQPGQAFALQMFGLQSALFLFLQHEGCSLRFPSATSAPHIQASGL